MNKAFEKILERLDSKKHYFQKFYEADGKTEEDECINKATQLAFDDAKNIVQEVAEEYNGGWIPCSERLPDIEADVLLTLRSLDIYTGFRANADGYFHVHGTDNKYIPFENVIAWQQLPEPFKERD